MKILLVSATMDDIKGGGNAERTYQLCRYLQLNEKNLSLLTLDIGLSETRKKTLSKYDFFAIPCINNRFGLFFSNFKQIAQKIKSADIIHIIGHWSMINVICYLYAKKYNVPYLYCPAGAYMPQGRSLIIKKIFNFFIGKKILRNAKEVIAVTNNETKALNKYIMKPCIIIPNGICTTSYHAIDHGFPKNQFGINSPYFLFLGRLSYIKGADLLLEAFQQIKEQFLNYSLVFAGPDDGALTTLKSLIEADELNQRVFFTGHVSGETKSKLLHQAEYLIIPSRSEAMSIVILEAGMCKTPALFTDQCGINEFADISAGIKVEASITAISEGLVQLCQLTNQQRKKMGEILYQHVINNYTWEKVINQYLNLFNKLLSVKDK
ncbi:MAG: glycosyltransferase [Legionellales bacterium]|nr:glycosyltransferase [Legionellales bacterium]